MTVPPRYAALLGATALAAVFVSAPDLSPLYRVPEGQGAVVFNRLRGVRQTPMPPGWHTKLPIFERVFLMDTNPRSFRVAVSAVPSRGIEAGAATGSVGPNRAPVVS